MSDLVRKPAFVEPFIIACHTRHAKLAGIGVICLQRLIASRALPSDRLMDVLTGLKETTNLSASYALRAHLTPGVLTYDRSRHPVEDPAILTLPVAVLL